LLNASGNTGLTLGERAGQVINATRDDGVPSDGDVRRIETAPNIGEVDRTVVSERNGPSDLRASLVRNANQHR
jgi:hypothetical protein